MPDLQTLPSPKFPPGINQSMRLENLPMKPKKAPQIFPTTHAYIHTRSRTSSRPEEEEEEDETSKLALLCSALLTIVILSFILLVQDTDETQPSQSTRHAAAICADAHTHTHTEGRTNGPAQNTAACREERANYPRRS